MNKTDNQSKSSKKKHNSNRRKTTWTVDAKRKKFLEELKADNFIVKPQSYWVSGPYLKDEGEKIPKIIRRINSEYAKGIERFKMPLTKKDKKILDEYNIAYTIATYSATKRKAKT